MKLKQFFNSTIIVEDLKRFWGVSVLFFMAVFISGPLYILSQTSITTKYELNTLIRSINGFESHQIMSGVAGILLGVLLFRYLHNKNSVAVIHGYPFRRSELLNSHIISGTILISIPIVLNAIILAAIIPKVTSNINIKLLLGYNANIEQIRSLYSTKRILYWLLSMEILGVFSFLISVFSAMISGVIIIQGALSFILPFVPLFILTLVNEFLHTFVFGFRLMFRDTFATKIMPLPALMSRDLSYITWYIVLCILLYCISLLLYKKRDLEKTQDTIVFDILKPVFKYGMTFCAMLLAGGYFYSLKENTMWLFIGGFVGSLLGYLISEMILKKSARVFGSLKGYILYIALIAVVIVGIKTDLIGYEKRIPSENQIQEVYFNYLEPYDKGILEKKNIRSVLAIHRSIIDNKKDITTAQRQDNYSEMIYIRIGYLYKNGKKLVRSYEVPKSLLANNNSIKNLYESKEYKTISEKVLFDLDLNKVNAVNIRNHHYDKARSITDKSEIKELFEVLKGDMLAESYESMVDGNEWANIEFDINAGEYAYMFDLYLEEDNIDKDVYVDFKKSYHNLEKWFREKGYLKDIRILPEEVEHIVIQKANADYSQGYSSSEIEQELRMGNSKRVEINDKEKIEEILRTNDNHGFKKDTYIVAIYTKNGKMYYGWYDEENALKYFQ